MFEILSLFVGDRGRVYTADDYIIVEIDCVQWTFSEDDNIDMILESLGRYF